MSEMSDNFEALDRYFRANATKLGAAPLYASWRTWYDDLNPTGMFTFLSDSDWAEATKRRDALNAAMGQPNLVEQGFIPADKEPMLDTAGVAQLFAGGGKPPTIQKGSRGAAVRWVQQFLRITADGNFGSGTDAAVKKWQGANGLTPDGIVGPASWQKMGVHTVSDIQAPPSGLLGLSDGSVPLPKQVDPVKASQATQGTSFTVAPNPTFSAPKPASLPVSVAVSPGGSSPVVEAGMFGALGNLSTPVKIGIAAAVVAAIAATAPKKHKGHK